MKLECHILNFDTVAEKLGTKEQKIWAKFVFETKFLVGYMQYLEENELQKDCTEISLSSGKNYIINIPFEDFHNLHKNDF
mgnify:CR=1 FL=1